MSFNEKAERLRRQVLSPLGFRLYLWRRLPLAAAAGLRLRTLDEQRCTVSLPGGWRTQNPFRSTYFAAQAMAAEMSTGAPAMVLVGGASASVAMLVREVRGVFVKKIAGPSTFTFDGMASLHAAIERAAATGEGETFVARSIGTTADGTVAAEFEITWSFKRRG
ncbi:MAG TPA: DUF4442 domain-containing protein [Vicinamibacteria bacterium]